jgi:hypothetical protein
MRREGVREEHKENKSHQCANAKKHKHKERTHIGDSTRIQGGPGGVVETAQSSERHAFLPALAQDSCEALITLWNIRVAGTQGAV